MITVHELINGLELVLVGFVGSDEYLTCRNTLFNFWGFGVGSLCLFIVIGVQTIMIPRHVNCVI